MIPEQSYFIGGPKGGTRENIPGALDCVVFPVPIPDSYWVKAMLSRLDLDAALSAHVQTDIYTLRGVFKLYEYGGRF